MISYIFTVTFSKEDNFCDILLALLGKGTLPRSQSILLKGKLIFEEQVFFYLRGGRNENTCLKYKPHISNFELFSK